MSYFLSSQKLSIGQIIEITGEEAGHILLSRRLKKGERMNLQGSDEKRYSVEITNVGKKDLAIKVLNQIPTPPEPEIRVTLFQAVVSEKALDFILQKATELGAYKIVLFNSGNVANKLSCEQFNKKQERWNKILTEAAKQCDRVRTPALEFLPNLEEVTVKAKDFNKTLLLDVAGNKISTLNPSPSTLGLITGPEGGFTSEEIKNFKSLPNCTPVCLSPYILRTETASMAGLVAIMNLA